MVKKRSRSDGFGGAVNECMKCHTANPPDRVFCSSCGAKLPLTDNPFADAPKPSRIRPVLKAVSHLTVVAVLAAVVMAFWPPQRIGMDGRSRSSQLFERKTEQLSEAIEAGRSLAVVVNEAEINAFLKRRLAEYLEQHRYDSGAVLQSIRMMLTPENAVVQVRTKHGPVAITRRVSGKPLIKENQFVFKIEKVAVGILPLPGPIATVVARRVAGVFSEMEPEHKIIGNLKRIELSEGKVRLTVE